MIFTFLENTAYVEKHEKYIKVEHKSQNYIKNFVDELDSMKIYHKLNQNINESPEDNYYRFANLVNSAREKHLPTKIVKYKFLLSAEQSTCLHRCAIAYLDIYCWIRNTGLTCCT